MKILNHKKENFDVRRLLFWQVSQTGAIEKHEKIDLEKQWRVAFVLMVVLGLSMIAFEVYLFTQIDSNSIFISVAHEKVEVETLNVSEIERTILHYQEKNKAFESLLFLDARFNQAGTAVSDITLDEGDSDSFGTTTEEAGPQ